MLLLVFTAACAQQPREQVAAAALQDALTSHQASMAGVGAPQQAMPAEAARLAPSGPIVAPQAAAAPPQAGAAPPAAGSLVGQTPETVRQWLGEPRLRRSEGPAEIWHYQASQCHLDLVLYPDEGSQPILRVAFAAARAAGAMRRGEAACLRDIARGATRPGLAVQAASGA